MTRYTTDDEMGRAVSRMLASYGRRVATADPEQLAQLVALQAQLDDIAQAAVDGLRATGFTWAEIGQHAGITKQGAQQRWGRPAARTA